MDKKSREALPLGQTLTLKLYPEEPTPSKRTWLPLLAISLAIAALLLVPIVVGYKTRQLRDDGILGRQEEADSATEALRLAVADEFAAARVLVATSDTAAADWFALASAERAAAVERLDGMRADLEPATQEKLTALQEATSRLVGRISPSVSADGRLTVADTAQLWSALSSVIGAAQDFRDAVDADVDRANGSIDDVEKLGLWLTALLTFIAFTSVMVTLRMQGQIRAFALDSERARLRMQILLESSGEGVFGLDHKGRCIFLNPAGSKLIGYTDDEVLRKDLREILKVRLRTKSGDGGYLKSSGFAGGPVMRVEETILTRKDGGTIEAECLTSLIIERGQSRGAVVTFRDIGRRKAVERERIAHLEAEQALRGRAEEAEKQAVFLAEAADLFATSLDYDTTLESVSRLVVPKIADSCVVYLMDEAGAVQRLRPAHIDPERQRILQEQFDRYPPHLESLIPPVRRALLQGESTLIRNVEAGDLKGVPGDQSHQSVIEAVGLLSLIVVPMRARGRIAGAISLGVMNVNRRFTTDDMRVAEVLVSRAALALDNARLYQQSQAAVGARNEVLGIVSHDLRNPLNAVRFGAQALLRHWPPMGDGALERTQLSAITKAADRMHRLIRDLLDIAQIDVGRLAVELEPIPAGILLEDALELIQHPAEEKSISVKVETSGELPLVNADGVRILQVFSNLLNNAVKFSPAGSTIVLSAERQEGEVVFTVRDQGRGIEPDLIPHIFNRFWRGRGDSGDGGAGLGLAIAQGIVESHDGRLWVESVVGTGSTFYFALPITGRRSQPLDRERVLRAG